MGPNIVDANKSSGENMDVANSAIENETIEKSNEDTKVGLIV